MHQQLPIDELLATATDDSVAKVAILNAEGRVLILRRSDTARHRPLGWDLPGGKVDPGETPLIAVKREAQEEAGLIIENVEIMSCHVLHSRLWYGYAAQFKIDQTVTLSREHDRYAWVTHEELKQYDMTYRHLATIAAARSFYELN